jgi:hypothetical protein
VALTGITRDELGHLLAGVVIADSDHPEQPVRD